MKLTSFCICCLLALFFSVHGRGQQRSAYTKADLQKLRWIEGNWSGIHKNSPFYELYRFADDTTLQITSYEWNGKDSTHSSVSYLRWDADAYFLGDSLNWKVTAITNDRIAMMPHRKASNAIVWMRTDKDGWDAVLTTVKGETLYQMKRIAHFKN